MTAHISAENGDIAETVLMPGDPLRAKWIAETYLTDPVCYSSVRNMYGFTGMFRGQRLSVQGSGMGMPSLSIYSHELLESYGVKTLIRVGSAGALTDKLNLREVVAASGATSESNLNRMRFNNLVEYAPVANFDLLRNAVDIANEQNKKIHVGPVLSGDVFYGDPPGLYKKLAEYGVLAVEMEAAELYTVAAKFGARALALVTISDNLVTDEHVSAEERQSSFADMVEIALEIAIR
ncbi:purine-nucleoside phosphorylase [Stackebrandtia soli]|uniref:purine-nucleoside phosphorylase n=1 Tax=Stackebrandtia soli TaxID=1892856 RepID=UPI0039E87DC8